MIKFIRGIENFDKSQFPEGITATLGTFDGIHLGHHQILKDTMDLAKEKKQTPLLITFHPHPRTVVTPDDVPMLLTTIEEKTAFIPHFFKGVVLILEFNKDLMSLSPEKFVEDLLIGEIGMKSLVVGYDHAFGKNRSGDREKLTNLSKLHNFTIKVVDPVLFGKKPVSSTRIRELLIGDKFDDACKLLGHNYSIFGTVEKGIGLGRKLGYPTANVKYSQRKLLPMLGVYACSVNIDDDFYYGMLFIGRNHFSPIEKITVEVNIFEFDKDIYGKEIIVNPISYLRKNELYESTEKLVEQIKLDKKDTIEIIKKEKKHDNQQRAKSSNCC